MCVHFQLLCAHARFDLVHTLFYLYPFFIFVAELRGPEFNPFEGGIDMVD